MPGIAGVAKQALPAACTGGLISYPYWKHSVTILEGFIEPNL